uniref:ATP-dependent DNA helicase n=1 Tax=Manihot esculenta TaxID=3983 RepID=A0A2C9V5J4_MANES
MAKRLAIETIDRILKDIMNNSQPFGRKLMAFGGDFRQVLPVVPKPLRQKNVSASLIKSYLWSKMEVLKLTTNMRVRTYQYFGEFILRVGNREELETKEDNIRIPEEMVVKYENENSCEEVLIDAVYSSLEKIARLA